MPSGISRPRELPRAAIIPQSCLPPTNQAKNIAQRLCATLAGLCEIPNAHAPARPGSRSDTRSTKHQPDSVMPDPIALRPGNAAAHSCHRVVKTRPPASAPFPSPHHSLGRPLAAESDPHPCFDEPWSPDDREWCERAMEHGVGSPLSISCLASAGAVASWPKRAAAVRISIRTRPT